MIKKIRTEKKDKILLQTKCIPLESTDTEKVRKVFRDLHDTAEHLRDKCLGLSANQIGFPVRAFVMRCGTALIKVMNPEIIKASDKMVRSEERCLSLPARKDAAILMRHKRLTVRFTNPDTGKVVKLKLVGRDAIVFQHELDHSNGKLI